jgi:hypothetical protein
VRAGGRPGGWAGGLLIVVLTAGPPARLPAQVALHAGVGLRYTSTLVHDSIVSPFDVRAGIAPVLVLTATAPLERGWSAELLLDYAWSDVARHEGGVIVGLGRVRTLATSVALRHGLPAGLSGRIGVGGLTYLPPAERGIFRQGSGPLTALGSLGLRYEPRLGTARGAGFAVEARYDVHGFITPALRSEGFASPRLVHRVALVLSGRAAGRERAP